MADPLVSIICITYNHEPYIRQCLDGFMMQKTNFPFEVLIHDDASTDKTADIIREYESRYPDVIKPIYQTENQYSKGVRIGLTYLYPNAKGKYIAECEGDDYWTDPLKLQRQIDFLECNEEYSMCFTNAIVHYEDNSKEDILFADLNDRDYTGVELFKNWLVPTATIVFKQEILKTPLFIRAFTNKYFVFSDILLILSCSTKGRIWCQARPTAVYRRTKSGALSKQDSTYEGQRKYIRHITEIASVFGEEFHKDCDRIILLQYYALFKQALHERQIRKAFSFIRDSLSFSTKGTIRLYRKKCISFVKRRIVW